MHEYELLEKRWLRFKVKRYLLALFVVVATISVAIGGYSLFSHKKIVSQHRKHNNLLLPSLTFEKNLQLSRKLSKKVAHRVEKKRKRDKKTLHIASEQMDIKELTNLYDQNPDPDLAIMIAQRYFQRKEYENALQWSIKSNELDKNLEQSWLLFAKSSYKLGRKNRAINALRIYIRKSGSQKAKELLMKMLQGTYR